MFPQLTLLRAALATGLSALSFAAVAADFNVQPSWNLLGYVNSAEALNLTDTFNDKTKVTTVWRWNRDSQKWGFYSPVLDDGGKAYAAEKGYEHMTSIASTEGFWVNAKEAFAIPPKTNASSSPVVFEVKPSWNLLGYQNTAELLDLASKFNDKTKVTTVWKWLRSSQKWAFYSPMLNDDGKVYSAEKGYEHMTTVAHSEGFWVNAKEAFAVGKATMTVATRPLNDTGVTFFANDTQNSLSAEPPGHPRQDASVGRDALAAAGKLTKVGGGRAGFDFTKIANDGSVLPETAPLGSGDKDWACTRDNVTGLIWEVKTTSGLRRQSHTYTWYNSDVASNGGSAGTASGGTCFASGRCDTEKYVQDVNAAGLCGASDWRMPNTKQLEGIADMGRVSPAIDITYFPNTPDTYFWSGSPYPSNSRFAWFVSFNDGYADGKGRESKHSVRLMRGEQ